jgi:hypothetical protein
MSTFTLQNRIRVTGRCITGMVVTEDDNVLLCDVNVAVYYPNGKYMKTIDDSLQLVFDTKIRQFHPKFTQLIELLVE